MENDLKQDLRLVTAHKRDRRYKRRYLLHKKIAIVLFVMLTGMAYLFGMALYGNLKLAQRLEKAQTITILPNGTVKPIKPGSHK